MSSVLTLCFAALLFAFLPTDTFAQKKGSLFREGRVVASSQSGSGGAAKAFDSRTDLGSAWMSDPAGRGEQWLEIEFDTYVDLDSVVVHTCQPTGLSLPHHALRNFVFQYWDDANWTDLDETLTRNNRSERIVFRFHPAVTSFRFRLFSNDKTPVVVTELEGYGRRNAVLPSPEKGGVSADRLNDTVRASVHPTLVGRSMHYVGYNQGYFIPGSNVSGWVEYSQVNTMRLWMPLDYLVPESAVDTSLRPAGLEEFDRLKERVRRDPRGCGLIDWEQVEKAASAEYHSVNTMVYNYALDELKRLGVEALIQTSAYKSAPDWATRWLLWLRMYALTYYSAKRSGVEMYAMQNEPNHRSSGPIPLDEWIRMMRVASDAVHCGVADASRDGAGDLRGKFVGPVTTGLNTDWWAAVAAAEGTDYRGNPCAAPLVDLFSTHAYNMPASGYAGKVSTIDRILRENHPRGESKPIIFTEIGRWMNAYLIDKEETTDPPSLGTERAGIYVRNMLDGCYGMWAFKLANTRSPIYPLGIKSGHHHIWKGLRFAEDSFVNHAAGCRVSSSGCDAHSSAAAVVDGDKSDGSAWRCTGEGPKWVMLELDKPTVLGGMAIYTGSDGGEFTAPDRLRNLVVEAEHNGSWQTVAEYRNCRYAQLFLRFEHPLSATRIRISTDDMPTAVIREIKLFGEEFIEAGDRSYDIGGPQRTAQVVRLFAKGFRGDKALLQIERSNDDPDLDLVFAADSTSNTLYGWVVSRSEHPRFLQLNFAALGLNHTPVICEEVSRDHYGEARLAHVDMAGCFNRTLPAQSVMMLTLPLSAERIVEIDPIAACTCFGDGSRSDGMTVHMDASHPQQNAAAKPCIRPTDPARPSGNVLVRSTVPFPCLRRSCRCGQRICCGS